MYVIETTPFTCFLGILSGQLISEFKEVLDWCSKSQSKIYKDNEINKLVTTFIMVFADFQCLVKFK